MTDVAVLGGGLAGSAAAIALARGGADVTLIEREKAAFGKVCGEFLSGEALIYLDRLGVDVRDLGAKALTSVRLRRASRSVQVPLPFDALALSRSVLDEHLIGLAADAGVQVRRGTRVRGFDGRPGSWTVATDAGPIVADAVFLATGKHDVRGWPRTEDSRTHSGLAGFKQHWRLTDEQRESLGDAVELILFPGGYCGFTPIENGDTNVCLLIDKTIAAGSATRLGECDPAVAARLVGANPLDDRPFAVSSIPYGYVAPPSDGAWRLGDQAAVIPSFAGDGMSIALHTAALAVSVYASGGDATRYQTELAQDVTLRIRAATGLSKAMVSGRTQRPLLALAGTVPGMVDFIAKKTRLSDRAMARAAR